MKRLRKGKLGAACWGAVLLMLGMSAAWAQPAERSRGNAEGRELRVRQHFVEMCEKLKLSDQQKAQLDANRERHRGEMEALMGQVSAKRKELRAALQQSQLDMGEVIKIHQALKELMAKMEDRRLEAILEIRSILTPEQFAQFQAMEPKGPKGHRRGPPPGPPEGEGEK